MVIKVDSAGKILIPAETRKFLGIEQGELIKMELVGRQIIITLLEEEEEEDLWKKKEQI